jgi:peptidoglycan/LPS O-acetylase OafA/YrhL
LEHHENKLLSYRPDIDGLRSFAIIPVVLFHANAPFLTGGFIGVDVFFVISGFLIGSLVYRELTAGRFSLRRFYERRAKRILPALFAVLAFTLFAACILLSGEELKGFAGEMLATLTSSSNVYFGLNSDYFAAAAELHPLLMSWSLGVEEQFYIFFPLVLFLLVRYARRHILAVLGILSLMSLAVALLAVHRFPTPTFYLLPSRAWELGLGAMLGIFETTQPGQKRAERVGHWKEVESVVGLGMLLFGIFNFTRDTIFPGLAALVPTVAAVLLIRARGSWINRRILASKPLVAIGLLSYSWYLWHWPLMSFARIAMAGELPLRIGLAIVVLSLGIATLSYYLVEQPFRKPALQGRSILWGYGVATVLWMIPAVVFLAIHGWPGRYPAAAAVDAATLRSGPDPCLVRYRKTNFIDSVACTNRDASLPTLAILGDSHAAALAPYLRDMAPAAGWRVDDLTKASCPPLGSVTRYMPARLNHDIECETFNQNVLRFVIDSPNIRTVVLSGYWTAPFPDRDNGERFVGAGDRPNSVGIEQSWKNLQSGLLETVQRLQAQGKRVLLVVDAPRLMFDPVLAARTNAIPARLWLDRTLGGPDVTIGWEPLSSLMGPVDIRANAILAYVANQTGAGLVDLPHDMCPDSMCRFKQGSAPFYVDTQHLSFEGAQFALREAGLFH